MRLNEVIFHPLYHTTGHLIARPSQSNTNSTTLFCGVGALDEGDEFALLVAHVEVHGAVDGLVGGEVHFAPVGDPAGQAAQGEKDREHVWGCS